MDETSLENKDLPAFAGSSRNELGNKFRQFGLTKREYFAAKALQGIMSVAGEPTEQKQFDRITEAAIRVADTLLAALANERKLL